MYAIVECGGKQYKVEKDMLVKVEKIDAEIGDVVELKTLMLVDDNGKFPLSSGVFPITVPPYREPTVTA